MVLQEYSQISLLQDNVTLLPNIHKQHSIAHPQGRTMGCCLWVQILIYILHLSLLQPMMHIDRYIMRFKIRPISIFQPAEAQKCFHDGWSHKICTQFCLDLLVLVIWSFFVNPSDLLSHISQGSFTGTGKLYDGPCSTKTITTRKPAFWESPQPPYDYPYYWFISDPKSKTRQSQSYTFKKFWNFAKHFTCDIPSEAA